MDDQQFDHIIKRKVAEYEDPGFDDSALSALHQQMTNATAWPWYTRYRTELLVSAGMVLCTLAIIFSQWYFSLKQNPSTEAAQIGAQQEQIKNLLHEITLLKDRAPDTIHIVEARGHAPGAYSLLLMQKIVKLEEALAKIQTGFDTSLSDSLMLFSNAYTTAHSDRSTTRLNMDELFGPSKRLQPIQGERLSAHADKKTHERKPHSGPALSAETLRNLEKHYQKGIGIRVGPTVEISHGLYDGGTAKLDYAGGLLGDFIFSPSLSVETGAKFLHRFYEISEANLSDRALPHTDNTLGPLMYADIDTWILEVPLNFKYRYPLNLKKTWIASLGYSSQIYTRQVFEYDYAVDGNPGARFNTSTAVKKVKLYPGTVNISLGLGHQIKKNNILETSLFYQYGLGEGGIEKMKANFFGIRSSYWFILK